MAGMCIGACPISQQSCTSVAGMCLCTFVEGSGAVVSASSHTDAGVNDEAGEGEVKLRGAAKVFAEAVKGNAKPGNSGNSENSGNVENLGHSKNLEHSENSGNVESVMTVDGANGFQDTGKALSPETYSQLGSYLGCTSIGSMCTGVCPPGTQCGMVAGTCLCTL